MVESGQISIPQIKRGIACLLLFAILCGAYLVSIGGYPILIIGVLSLFFAYAYTGGPYPLAYHGLGDIFVMIFFGPVAVCGTYYLLTGRFDLIPFILSLALGSIIVAILVVNNLRDREGDALVNKNTLAVRFGDKFSRNQYLILMTLGVAIPLSIVIALSGKVYLIVALLMHILFSYSALKDVSGGTSGAALNSTLAKTGQAALFLAVVCSICWNL
jgi:1,4-dihydroxy-2-naphthoate octaprenyltransferase